MMISEECQRLRRETSEAGEGKVRPELSAAWREHTAQCPACAGFQRQMEQLDRLAVQSARAIPPAGNAARERLHASWLRLGVRRSWLDRLRFRFRREFEPRILRPLLPHAAVIIGFIFFTSSVMVLQSQTGLFTVRTHFNEPRWQTAQVPVEEVAVDRMIRLG